MQAIIDREQGESEMRKRTLHKVMAFLGSFLFLFVETGQGVEPAPTSPARRIEFARDVYPIFEGSCHSCHGSQQQLGGLRLDSRQSALAGGQSGRVIESFSPTESPLYQRVAGLNDLARMPMGGALRDEQIELIRAWIEQGAKWPEGLGKWASEEPKHWAFVAPKRPSLPPVAGKAWPVNEIDHFILARLEREGLSASAQADRVTLLRRLSLDLIGLPPSIEEVDAFLLDQRADAYQRQVERLLASPHYGERWGRHWLDAARYADSDGFEQDKPRKVWFYRDWVINALNRDLPYDQFIIQQIAGDLLPDASQDQIVATGFLRNSMVNEEGGIDPEQFRMEAMFDRMDAIGKSVLGITIQCAQCHDHKYDPLRQEEYYRLFAFLNNAHEANAAVYTPAELMRRVDIFKRIREIESDLKGRTPDWQDQMSQWAATVRADQPPWTVLRPTVEDISTSGQKYLQLEDGSLLAQGFAPSKHRVEMSVQTDLKNITAFRLELLNDPNLPLGGPGRSVKGTAALTEFEVEAAPSDAPEKREPVKIVAATADPALAEAPLEPFFDDESNQPRVTGPVDFAIDGNENTAWGIDEGPGRRNLARKAVFVAEHPVSHPRGTLLTFYLSQKHGGRYHRNQNLGRFRLSVTTVPQTSVDPLPTQVREILSTPFHHRTLLSDSVRVPLLANHGAAMASGERRD